MLGEPGPRRGHGARDLAALRTGHGVGHGAEPDFPRAYLRPSLTRLRLNEPSLSARARREEAASTARRSSVDLEVAACRGWSSRGGVAGVPRSVPAADPGGARRPAPARGVRLRAPDRRSSWGLTSRLAASSPSARESTCRGAAPSVGLARKSTSASCRPFWAAAGDVGGLVAIRADDAVMISDGGPEGRTVAGSATCRDTLHRPRASQPSWWPPRRGGPTSSRPRSATNGRPAVVFWSQGRSFAALLLASPTARSSVFHRRLGAWGACNEQRGARRRTGRLLRERPVSARKAVRGASRGGREGARAGERPPCSGATRTPRPGTPGRRAVARRRARRR